jgi:glycosyltransferase involved in cell wall biosynthesis
VKIGILVYGLERRTTGIGRHSIESIRHLVKLHPEWEIVLLAAGGTGGLKDLNLPTIHLKAKLAPVVLSYGQLELAYWAQRLQLDMLHDTSGMTALSLIPASTKRIVTIYDVIPWIYPQSSTAWDRLVYRHWLPKIAHHCDAVLTISENSKADITRYLHVPAEKIHNISAGYSPNFQPVDTPEIIRQRYHLPESYILYVGSVEERKNLVRVLWAFAQIRQAGFQQHLVIVGPQKWKYGAIKAAIDEANLGEFVSFTGYVADSDLPALYSGAELFVFPSLYEGFGLPVLEAMACAVPVVTSNNSSLAEIAGHGALQVDPFDTNAIAQAMLAILQNPDLARQLREAGLKQAKVFSWEHTARMTAEVYRQVMAE